MDGGINPFMLPIVVEGDRVTPLCHSGNMRSVELPELADLEGRALASWVVCCLIWMVFGGGWRC